MFYAQIIFNSLILGIYTLLYGEVMTFGAMLINLLALLIEWKRYKIVYRINFFLQLFLQALLIPLSLYALVKVTTPIFNWQLLSSLLLLFAINIVMYIPYIVIFLSNVKNYVLQIIVAFYTFGFIAMGSLDIVVYNTVLEKNHIIKMMINSTFIGALIFMILVLILMHRWGYALPKMRLNNQANIFIVTIILVVCIWYILWNAFAIDMNSLKSFFVFNFRQSHLTASFIFSGLEAGIAEELLFRFACLSILMKAFDRFKYNIFYSATLSSLLFGLIHLTNLGAGQDLANTLTQAISAFGMGMVLAAIYLYTDLFYWNVIFHSLIDIVSFSVSGQLMTGKVTVTDNIVTGVETLIFIALAFLLLRSVYNRRNRSTFNFNLI